MSRVVVWFSCGAASAVTAKLAVEKYGKVEVVYCDTSKSENPDNSRFRQDVERWIGQSVTIIKSKKYNSIDDVFEQTRYMAGPRGARCTVEMKKLPRFDFQLPDDLHLFGYTVDEQKRIARFEQANPELCLEWILRDRGLNKPDCFERLKQAGIELPLMYRQGFKNNNCIGCVKASSPSYWNQVRLLYPEVFQKRVEQSRKLGARLTRIKEGKVWRHAFIDELVPEDKTDLGEDLSCGPECTLEDK